MQPDGSDGREGEGVGADMVLWRHYAGRDRNMGLHLEGCGANMPEYPRRRCLLTASFLFRMQQPVGGACRSWEFVSGGWRGRLGETDCLRETPSFRSLRGALGFWNTAYFPCNGTKL